MKKSILCGIAATACWGFSNVFTKILLAHFEPLSLLAMQLIASNIAIWLFVFKTKSKLPAMQSLKFSLPGILQPGMAFIFGVFGLNLTTANNDALIWATETIVVIFLAAALLGEKIGLYLWLLAICGTGGTILATTASFDWQTANGSMLAGNILIFAGVLCAAFYNIYTHRQLTDIEPLHLTALHQLSGLILVIIIWLCLLPTITWPAEPNIFILSVRFSLWHSAICFTPFFFISLLSKKLEQPALPFFWLCHRLLQ